MENLTNEELFYCARISEQVERYPQMLDYMRVLISRGVNFDAEERNLLSVAYKNAVGPQRTSWRIMDTLEKKERSKADSVEKERNIEHLRRIKGEVEAELLHTCMEIIGYLENTLVKGAQTDEGKIFFLKMQGDYFRYLAEFQIENADNKLDVKTADKALEAYEQALKLAEISLQTTDPIRLGLALNFSVFYYEIKNDPKKACELAKMAFDDAIADIENIQESNYKDSTTIMQLMRDNLTLWTSELEDD